MPKQIDPNDTIAIGFQVQYQLDDGRALAFSSCLDAECTATQLNAALDKLVQAGERQQAKIKLPRLRKDVERLMRQHERAKEDMFRLDSEKELSEKTWEAQYRNTGKRGEFKLSPAQINERNKRNADRDNAETTYRRMEEEIKFRLDEIEELEKLVALASTEHSNSSLPNC